MVFSQSHYSGTLVESKGERKILLLTPRICMGRVRQRTFCAFAQGEGMAITCNENSSG
jgi:hypothetical protein